MKPAILLISISLLGGACAPKRINTEPLVKEEKTWLEFSVFPKVMVVPGKATLFAKIHGPIEWCPQSIRWVYGSGSSSKDVECLDRTFSIEVEMRFRGLHRLTVEIFSGSGRPGFASMDYQVGREND